jgi:hypothetical protein
VIGALLAAASVALVAGCGDSDSATHKAAVVAPVFKHGEGLDVCRCSPFTASIVLSEDDALLIIAEELRLHGVALSKRSVEMPSVIVSRRERRPGYEWTSGRASGHFVRFDAPLEFDGVDAERRVAVEFVSCGDYDGLAGPWFNEDPYVWTGPGELQRAAGYVADCVRGQPETVYFGVFYDPLECPLDYDEFSRRHGTAGPGRPEPSWDEVEQEARERSVELLRQQVRDFVEWLQGQGVI